MNSLPTNHRTRANGFTLVELMVSLAVFAVVSMMIFSVLLSTMKLSTQNAVANVSNYRARQTSDRIGEIVRYAQDTPVLINADGTLAAGTTSDGILVKNALGGPYVFKNSNGQADADIPSGTTSFSVDYAPSAGVGAPQVGDFFSLALSTQPELEVASVGSASVNGPLSSVQITTKTGITEIAKPGSYTVTAYRYRKEAYVFVQSGTQWSLRHYARVTATTSYTNPLSYSVLGTGFQKLGNQAWFTTTISNGTQASWLHAVARSSDHAEYAESIAGRNTLTSMPVQIKLWNYNAPPPSP
ncbi:MAG: prepilin-type N-terminal cleavage/methylation domain-containing protein [Chthoniobacteraceae bacterium]